MLSLSPALISLISDFRNFRFWEIYAHPLTLNHPAHEGHSLKKTQHTREYKRLIEELKSARKAAGYTQLEAATALDKHPPFISKIESGERRVDVIELATICRLYKIKVTTLIRKAGLD